MKNGLQVIVNADDFGITEGATDAIVHCHEAGSVTSASFMSTMVASEYAANRSRSVPALGLGLHFNLTLGVPAAPADRVRTLLGTDGRFLSRGALLRRVLRGGVRRSHVEAELRAQWQRMCDLGLQPTHIDSHQHVHGLAPQVFLVAAEFAAAQEVPLRVPWRWKGTPLTMSWRRWLKVKGLEASCAVGCAIAPRVRANDGFCSVFDLDAPLDSLSVDSYLQLLQPYQSGIVELMVHPAYRDEALDRVTAIGAVSACEAELLAKPELVRELTRRGAVLTTYRAVR